MVAWQLRNWRAIEPPPDTPAQISYEVGRSTRCQIQGSTSDELDVDFEGSEHEELTDRHTT